MADDVITDSPDLGTMIGQAIDSRLVDVHTSMPGRVESYDRVTQTASIRPQLKRVLRRRDGTRVAEELPVIPSVPVRFPRVAGFFIHFPIAVGDFGTLVFAEYDIGRWRTIGDVVDPGDTRRHGLSGAEFVPGVFPRGSAIPDSDLSADQMRMGAAGAYVIEINDAGEIQLPAGAATFLARADRVLAELSAIVSGFNSHTHTVPIIGAAGTTPTTMPLLPLPPAADPKSDTVKGT